MKRVAVIGAGVSGLACADALGAQTAALFDSSPRPGGHAHTLAVQYGGVKADADVAFMVYNRGNYPHFCRLLEQKQIAGRPTDMSFSVVHEEFNLEYNGGNLRGLFADPRNFFCPRFRRMLADVFRFNRIARRDLRSGTVPADETVAQYVVRRGLSGYFADAYLLPMGASIWSCSRGDFAATPARFALSFFDNYGLLQLFGRPQWMHVPGGSHRYVKAIVNSLAPGTWRGGATVTSVRAEAGGVFVRAENQNEEHFNAAVLAVHAPDALQILSNPSDVEREVLSSFTYTDNRGALHTDDSILPSRRAARACWNYRVFGSGEDARAAATYDLSLLQHLPRGKDGAPLLLTLNAGIAAINPDKILAHLDYAHPLPDAAAMKARARADEINGQRGLFFCGAYWGDGFHEDGAASGARAAQAVMEFLA